MTTSLKLFGSLAAATLTLAGTALARQNEPMTTVAASSPATSHAGKTFNVKITLSVPAGYHVYSPVYKGDTGVPVTVKAEGLPKGLALKAIQAPRGETLMGNVVFKLPVSVASSVHGKKSFKLKVRYQQCNDRICLPPQNAFVTVTTNVK